VKLPKSLTSGSPALRVFSCQFCLPAINSLVIQTRSFSVSRRRPFWGAFRLLRGLVTLLLVLAAIAVFTLWMGQGRIGSELARVAEQAVNARLVGSGWIARIPSASLMGTGQLRIEEIHLDLEGGGGGSTNTPVRLGPVDIFKSNLSEFIQGDFVPDLIQFSNSEIRINLSACSVQQLQILLESLRPKQIPKKIPVFRAAGCRLVVTGNSDRGAAPLILYDVDFESSEQTDQHGRRFVQFAGDYFSSRFDSANFSVSVWPELKYASGLTRLTGLKFHQEDLQFLSEDFRSELGNITSLHASSDLRIDFSHDAANAQPVNWMMSGQLSEFAFSGSRCPLPLSQFNCDFVIRPDLLEIRNATGKAGTAFARGDFTAAWPADGTESMQWSAVGRIDDLNVESVATHQLPEQIAILVKRFSPRGIGDLEFDLGSDGKRLRQKLNANIQDMAITFQQFPYPLEHCVGWATCENGKCTFSVNSLENGQIVEISGWLNNPGPDALFQVDFACNGDLPIDEKLFRAVDMYPQISRQIRDLRPRGTFGVAGVFSRLTGGNPPVLNYRVDMKNCQARHAHFDYPVREISGRAIVEGKNIRFENIQGANSSSRVQATGNWNPADGLNLRFLADDVVLDNQLRAALPKEAVAAWDAIRPAGRIELVRVDLKLAQTPGSKLEFTVDGQARSPANAVDQGVSIRPAAFPLEFSRISADLHLQDGLFSVTRFRGENGRSWVASDASGNWSTEGWSLNLENMTAGMVEVNESLLHALPSSLSAAMEKTSFAGTVQVSGKMAFSTMPATDIQSQLDQQGTNLANHLRPVVTDSEGVNRLASSWDLQIGLNGAEANLGLPLKGISGVISIRGNERNGKTLSTGTLDLDTVSVLGAWATNLSGPVWIDNQRAAIGKFAADQQSGQVAPTVAGRLFGGQLSLDAQCWDDRDGGKFYAQALLESGQLAQAGGCLADELCQAGGVASCVLRCSGDLKSTESVVGEGMLQLAETRLYELPVMMAILKPIGRRGIDRTAFDSGNINFGLRGDQIDLNRIELNGDAISLIGNGTLDWRQRVDLDFYTVMGRNRVYIPLLSELYQAGSQQIMWLSVDGTLDNPQIRQQILPGINEGLRALLEPPDRSANRLN